MTENERVRIVRKVKGLTLEKFGELIGMGKSSISDIENGRRPLTNQSRLAICRVFGISEDWLRKGEGEMFLEFEEAAINEISDKYHLEGLDKEAFKLFLKLDDAGRRGLMTFLLSFAGKVLESPALYRQYRQARGELPKLSKANIEEEVAAYRAELELLAAVEVEEETSAGVPTKSPQEMSEAELHAELDRQLAEEKKQADGQSAFGPGNSEKATG